MVMDPTSSTTSAGCEAPVSPFVSESRGADLNRSWKIAFLEKKIVPDFAKTLLHPTPKQANLTHPTQDVIEKS
jgi:hypothetical protein